MAIVVIVSAQAASWRGFTKALKAYLSADIRTVGSFAEAVSLAQNNNFPVWTGVYRRTPVLKGVSVVSLMRKSVSFYNC